MGVLKELTKEYFGEKVRKEDEIDIFGLDVKIVSFKDNNGNFHKRGYKPKDLDNLKDLLERMVEVRGDEGDFNDIDTSEITSIELLFAINTFNGNISGWDVSNVKNMKCMFNNATSFNQPIGKWDVSSVKNMSFMFRKTTSFNQDISKWNIQGVNVYNMFKDCPIQDEYKQKME